MGVEQVIIMFFVAGQVDFANSFTRVTCPQVFARIETMIMAADVRIIDIQQQVTISPRTVSSLRNSASVMSQSLNCM